MYGPVFDEGYNARGAPEPVGCVDIHTTSGSTSVDPASPQVTVSGSDFRENTTFALTYLFPNDPGDVDGDAENQMYSETNFLFCHRLFFSAARDQFIRETVTTNGAGSFGPTNVHLAPHEVGGVSGLGVGVLNGELCITGPYNPVTKQPESFLYKGPVPPETGGYMATFQSQSVPITLVAL